MTDVNKLISDLKKYNDAYRSGNPIVSDEYYDLKTEELRSLDPNHPFLVQVEPEPSIKRTSIRHSVSMLSMEKAYSKKEIADFIERVRKTVETTPGIAFGDVFFEASPKLDGLAGKDENNILATRGNGDSGYDVSDAFTKGVVPVDGRNNGVGEICMSEQYFLENLSDQFEHPRNVVVGAVMSDEPSFAVQKALNDGAIRFVPYSTLKNRVTVKAEKLLADLESIVEKIKETTEYPMDGVVIEAKILDESANKILQSALGSTSHHNRWQIAIKSKGEVQETSVVGVTWQVGRTGKITPVLEVAPVKVSGATIRRVTAHNAGMASKLGTGPGSRIMIIRSGEVIPKIEEVLEKRDLEIPEKCPVCKCKAEMDSEFVFLLCNNDMCPAKNKEGISHWFKTIGTVDLFGPKTIDKIVVAGYTTVSSILQMTAEDFMSVGFSEKQASNLVREVARCKATEIDDWRLLAAMGIQNLGRGDSKKLLRNQSLVSVFDLTVDDIVKIDGFATKTATTIVDGLAAIKDEFEFFVNSFDKIIKSGKEATVSADGTLKGMKFVFTGAMTESRENMQGLAEQHGGISQSSVNKTTNFLVVGNNVGETKMKKARDLGVKILTEEEFRGMI